MDRPRSSRRWPRRRARSPRIGDLAGGGAARGSRPLTGAEAGYVTSGAAAGLTLGAAAMLAGLDPDRMDRLPDTAAARGVLVQRSHRNAYDHLVRAAGARLVEFGERRRHDRRDGGGDRPGDGGRVLPRPGGGRGLPLVDVRRDGASPRPAGPRRRLDEPAAAGEPPPFIDRRAPTSSRSAAARRSAARRHRGSWPVGRDLSVGRPAAAGHGRPAGHLGPALAARDRGAPAAAAARDRPVDEDRQGGDRRAARRARRYASSTRRPRRPRWAALVDRLAAGLAGIPGLTVARSRPRPTAGRCRWRSCASTRGLRADRGGARPRLRRARPDRHGRRPRRRGRDPPPRPARTSTRQPSTRSSPHSGGWRVGPGRTRARRGAASTAATPSRTTSRPPWMTSRTRRSAARSAIGSPVDRDEIGGQPGPDRADGRGQPQRRCRVRVIVAIARHGSKPSSRA